MCSLDGEKAWGSLLFGTNMKRPSLCDMASRATIRSWSVLFLFCRSLRRAMPGLLGLLSPLSIRNCASANFRSWGLPSGPPYGSPGKFFASEIHFSSASSCWPRVASFSEGKSARYVFLMPFDIFESPRDFPKSHPTYGAYRATYIYRKKSIIIPSSALPTS